MATNNKFRSSNGARYLKAIFLEEAVPTKENVVYTLKDEDVDGFPSLYRLYMETSDPTEWRFAKNFLDGWEHWQMLCQCSWFEPIVARWREELELKIKGEALIQIQLLAEQEGKSQLSANKILLDGGWKAPQEKRGPGRPKKLEDVEKKKVLAFAERRRLQEDAERVLNS